MTQHRLPSFHLEPIDEENPAAGYRAIVDPSGIVDREALAQALVEEGLPTDAETVLALCEAEQAAIASLMWEGWDVAAPVGTMETPWPDAVKADLLGGTLAGRPMASEEQLRYRMIEHGFPRKHGHVNAFFAAQEQVTARLLRDGYQIEHPLGWIYPLIEGVFDGPDDTYDPQRHSLTVGLGELDVKDWLEGYQAMAQRGIEGPPRPLPDGYQDVDTGLADGPLSPGHEVWLRGHWLRFRHSDPEQGIFLVAKDGATWREGNATFTGLCRAVFILPHDLPPGSYRLEVRAILIPRDGLQHGALPDPVPVVADAAA